MGLDSSINLIVAAMDLSLVRLVRDAMRTADNSAAGVASTHPAACDRFESRNLHPTPVYEPRRVLHPTPRYEPRPVLHPTPRVECPPVDRESDCEPKPQAKTNPIQPPWKVMPWQNPPELPPVIKIVLKNPDVHRSGRLIDCFI